MKGTGPDRDRSLSTPRPWVSVQDPLDTTWRILHRLPDNNIIVAIVADEGDAKLICDAVNMRAA
jgi:hypothetical protein